MAVIAHRYEVLACPECGEQNETGYCWAHKHGAVRTTAIEVVPASQLAGAVEALREIERARHLEGKDTGTKADIMARIARDAINQHGGQ